MHDLIDLARSWLLSDPDPVTRDATRLLIGQAEAGNAGPLRDCFGSRLEFGTAGMRGALGPGPHRMNRALVGRVAAALGRYLLAQDPLAASKGVAVGYDGRHGSLEFAQDTAAVLGGMGIVVWLHPQVVPTPVLAFSLTDLGCAAGVMVTASHNPPEDNGYKVYWGNGAQIIPPHDDGIAAVLDRIDSAPPLSDLAALRAAGRLRTVTPDVLDRYTTAVLAQRVHTGHKVRAVYTAMHGVGYATLRHVLAAAGHDPVLPVVAQVEPDGDFPTVRFPNPEEKGALDLALALARNEDADLIVAHDPDADRLAVAVRDGAGGYRQLSGNQVGLLLADDLLRHGPQLPGRMVACSIVSSCLLQTVAAQTGARCVETLTGFKWIGDAALAWPGPFVFGFEEALGYSVGPVVRDKDGVSAALVMLDLAGWCQSQGRTVLDALTDLYRRVGFAASAQRSLTLPGAEGAARIRDLMAQLRAAPPKDLAGRRVLLLRDVEAGTATDLETGAVTPLGLPSSNVLAFDLEGGERVLARPSGTEPKIKFYFEVVLPLGPDEALEQAEARAALRMAELQVALLGPLGL
jgi:phosphomannomutase